MKDVEAGAVLCGSPAIPVRDFMTDVVLSRKLPSLFDQLKAAQKKITELEANINKLQKSEKAQEIEKVH